MKKILLISLFLLPTSFSNAQIKFQKSYGEFFIDMATCMVQTPDGGYCIAGKTGRDLADSADILVIRTDFEGNQIWSARLAGSKDDIINGITTTDDGGFILVGNTYSSPLDPTHTDIVVMKMDDGGFVYWSKTIGSSDFDMANSVIRSGDGGYIIFGSTQSYGNAASSALAIKIDDAGNQIWANISSSNGDNFFNGGDRTPDGGYIAAGGTVSLIGTDYYITKFDTAGNILWSHSYASTDEEYFTDIKANADGELIACGVGGSGGSEMTVLKFDSTGSLLWNFSYASPETDQANSIILTSDNKYLIGGYTNLGTVSNIIHQAVLLKIDTAGAIIWAHSYGDISTNSEGYATLETSDGYALCGNSVAFDPLGDFFLIKTDFSGGSGCYERTQNYTQGFTSLNQSSVYDDTLQILDEFLLTFNPITFTNQFSLICFSVNIGDGPENHHFEIFPNPASEKLIVTAFNFTEGGTVRIFDMTGRILISKELNKAEMTIPVNHFTQGMYFLQIETSKGKAVRSFIKE